MNHKNETFEDQRMELHGKFFHNCTFTNCELVFDGDRPPTFKDNKFVDSVFVFTGHATRTLYLLSNIYHAGEGGKEVIEKTFADIREHKLHGHEIKTIVQEAGVPVNVLASGGGFSLTFSELEELGVKRISTGGALARSALTALVSAANEMRESGTFAYTQSALSTREISDLL